ncbi:hypothetical protein SAY87_026650 [Trapa incisa]|uniref:Uncharacterized protein n=1 Tax=Trapa incisa TaxID=236973 RepID=A0AAN7GM62_9MYRT|nr:hypothetical protein SAY87_026650 [Trapa incisa]
MDLERKNSKKFSFRCQPSNARAASRQNMKNLMVLNYQRSPFPWMLTINGKCSMVASKQMSFGIKREGKGRDAKELGCYRNSQNSTS